MVAVFYIGQKDFFVYAPQLNFRTFFLGFPGRGMARTPPPWSGLSGCHAPIRGGILPGFPIPFHNGRHRGMALCVLASLAL